MKRLLLFLLVVTPSYNLFAQDNIDQKVAELLARMTLEEKIGQMTLYTSSWTVTGPSLRESYVEDVKAGLCGNIFNAHTAAYTRQLQQIAVEETRLGIPLLFGYDVIHGYKTIFPIPLAEACSWDIPLIEKAAELAAKEAAAGGLHWTFNPMADITRDPRWGRVAEGAGEDPYLASLVAAAKVRGYQGHDLSDPFTLLACVKHFAAYGASQAGRDYNTVDISERTLREVYLPPYKAAVEAGAATVMTSFNEYDGVPASGNAFLLNQVLRQEWGFQGFVVTDYTSINEMIPHGYSRDQQHAAEQAVLAGVDMDMQASAYQDHLAALVESGKVPIKVIDQAVSRILHYKFALGLFDDPYRYSDLQREKDVILSQELRDFSREAGQKSIVLLKNETFNGRPLLPLSDNYQKIALIGPLADNQLDLMGTWHASGDAKDVISLESALKTAMPATEFFYAKGCDTQSNKREGFAEAIEAANASEMIIIAMGENYQQSGEAASRSQIGLPGVQQELLEKLYATGKPIVMVLMAGRPLTIEWMDENLPAIVNAWHLGTMAGPAIADVLTGVYNPSGRLVISYPRNVGQIPLFYAAKNTGRPFSPDNKYTSKYIDVANEALYPFGYGLSYTEFAYSDLKLDTDSFSGKETLELSLRLKNTGSYAGEETVQLYIRDLVGSVTRPLKELKAFQKIQLAPEEEKIVRFSITEEMLRFYTRDMEFRSEPGEFIVYVGRNSEDCLKARFSYQ